MVTMIIHGLCTAATLRFMALSQRRNSIVRSLRRQVLTIAILAVVLLSVTLIEAGLWSLTYVAIGAIEDVEKAVYFSVVTFTTLGYGDVVPGEGWRVLAAVQAAVGILVFGWTTSLMITVVQRMSEIARSRAH